MDRSHTSQVKSVAFKLAAALERYQADFDSLAGRRFDLDTCRTVIRELAEIQNLSAALPQLAVDRLDVVSRHVQLLGLLLKRGSPQGQRADGGDITVLQIDHRATVDAMHDKCLRLVRHH